LERECRGGRELEIRSHAVDEAFLRRAVESSDLAALRAALYQATRDEELARLGPVAQLAPKDQARLVERSLELLRRGVDTFPDRAPGHGEIREIMDLVLGAPTRDEHFEVRRRMLAFEPFPFVHRREGGPLAVPDGFEVAIIGAGYAGLAMAIQLEQLGIPYAIFERRDEVGGTWSRNRYPDIRVDTLSITYELSLDEPYPWSQYFAPGAEVRGYLEHVARRLGVWEHIRLEHELRHATFDEARALWCLELEARGGESVRHEAAVVVSAAGLFSVPHLPEIEGSDAYQGELLHPTGWSDGIGVEDARVAIVGNGSTGVQLLAPIAERAHSVNVFQRTPQWISPRPRYGEVVSKEARWLFEHLPGYWNWCRYTSMINLFTWHEDFLTPDPEWQRAGGHITRKTEELRQFLLGYIREQVGGREDLVERLIPDHAPMVRRPVVDNGWYRALTRENVELVTEPIARFTKSGIETADGRERELDLVVMATGYDLHTYLWPVDYRGRRGAGLQKFWAEQSPRAYLGLAVPSFPNLFMLYGPNSQPVSGGISLPSWFQIWSAYIAQCLEAMLEGGHRTIEVRERAYEDFNRRLDEEASGMSFTADTNSVAKNYYVNAHGRLQVNTPFETADLWAMFERPDLRDFELG
jgi:4-hydroxyacetophenone monooxygenase